MTEHSIVCPMCGSSFHPSGNVACQSCPINSGCQLVCCPECGYETVDPSKSFLAKIAKGFFFRSSKLESYSPSIPKD